LTVHADSAENEKGRLPSTKVLDVSSSVQPDDFRFRRSAPDSNLRSRLKASDSAPPGWQTPCTDTAFVVHSLTKWPRIYVEYYADDLLPVYQHPVGRHTVGAGSTTLCLEQRFQWTGLVKEHAQSTRPMKPRSAVPACQPEVKNLTIAINATNAVYFALHGSYDSVVNALKCIRLERLPVYVVTVDCRDDTSTSVSAIRDRSRLGLSLAALDTRRCMDVVMTHTAWFLHSETEQNFIYVRRHDVTR